MNENVRTLALELPAAALIPAQTRTLSDGAALENIRCLMRHIATADYLPVQTAQDSAFVPVGTAAQAQTTMGRAALHQVRWPQGRVNTRKR